MTFSTTVTPTLNLLAAFDTLVGIEGLTLAKCYIAGTGTESSFRALSGMETFSAYFTDISRAIFTLVFVRLRLKFSAAFTAWTEKATVWEHLTFKEKRVLAPESIIALAMAGTAYGLKVIKRIGLLVGFEQAERDYVIDGNLPLATTVNTRMIVPFKGQSLLRLPVRASIATMSATPSGVIGSTPLFQASPDTEATPGTKEGIPIAAETTNCPLDSYPTGGTFDFYLMVQRMFLTPNSRIPIPKATARTEVMLRAGYHGCGSLKNLAAVLTDDFHRLIIAWYGRLVKCN